jgi:hypothetical protein
MQYVQLIYETKRGGSSIRHLPYDSATLEPIMARLRKDATLRLDGQQIGGVEKQDGKWIWWYETP